MNDILNYLPEKVKKKVLEEASEQFEFLEEIRLRSQKPIILKFSDNEKIINYFVTSEEILSCLQMICENSIYTYQNQIAEGFVTIKGGHRIGISGSCVVEDRKVININHVYSLNFRIARQVVGSGNNILKNILDLEKGTVYNTLIIAPPGSRKDYSFA